jgi:hypothetical protein
MRSEPLRVVLIWEGWFEPLPRTCPGFLARFTIRLHVSVM